MTNEALHIHFTPESQIERLEAFQALIENDSSPSHPNFVRGRMTDVSEENIIQFELELSPVVINFKGQRYKFCLLDRTGNFTIKHCRYVPNKSDQ